MYVWKIWKDNCLTDWSGDIEFDTYEDAKEDAEETIKLDMERLVEDGVETSRLDYEIEVEEVDDEEY